MDRPKRHTGNLSSINLNDTKVVDTLNKQSGIHFLKKIINKNKYLSKHCTTKPSQQVICINCYKKYNNPRHIF